MAKNLSVINNQPSEQTGLSHGTYYARKRKYGWTLYHQSFKDGKRLPDKLVSKIAYAELGFKAEWSFEEARDRCTALNKEKSLQHGKIRQAANRLKRLESIDNLLFSTEKIEAFQIRIEQENQGTEKHLAKMYSHFRKVQKLCKDLEILPHHYKENEKRIYKYLAANKISLDYSQKLLSLLNRWGAFVSKADGRYFEPVAPMRGIARERAREAHDGKKGVRTESLPISPELLKSKMGKLSSQNYNYLFLTVWFGLRPFEVGSISDAKIERNSEGLEFILVYQSKLVSLEKSKRYKAIPILFKEQKQALEIIKSKDYKPPIYKTMRNVFGEQYGLYGGRKGFTDLMLSRGYALEDISLWLGHTSIETTWAHYKNKNALKLPSPKKLSKRNTG